jgi:hypothetical protein
MYPNFASGVIAPLKFEILIKPKRLENAKKLNVIPLIGAEILFVFFSKTKRL